MPTWGGPMPPRTPGSRPSRPMKSSWPMRSTTSCPRLISMTLNRLAILAVQHSHDKPKVRALLEEAWQMAETSQDRRGLAATEWNPHQNPGGVVGDPPARLPRRGQPAPPAPHDPEQDHAPQQIPLL